MNPRTTIPQMADDYLVFHADYPTEHDPLHTNVGTAGGYCLHRFASVTAIDLFLNGQYQGSATLACPRCDVNRRYAQYGDRSLRSGFHCWFDKRLLLERPNQFDFPIHTDDGRTQVVCIRNYLQLRTLSIADVFVDIVGSCNLRCVMCPQGELESTRGERGCGFMSAEMLNRVLGRLREQGYHGPSMNLYNRGDPLLHPSSPTFSTRAMRTGSARSSARISPFRNLVLVRSHIARLT